MALALAEVLDAWRKGTTSKDYTGGLAALAMAFEPASPLHALPASKQQGSARLQHQPSNADSYMLCSASYP